MLGQRSDRFELDLGTFVLLLLVLWKLLSPIAQFRLSSTAGQILGYASGKGWRTAQMPGASLLLCVTRAVRTAV